MTERLTAEAIAAIRTRASCWEGRQRVELFRADFDALLDAARMAHDLRAVVQAARNVHAGNGIVGVHALGVMVSEISAFCGRWPGVLEG